MTLAEEFEAAVKRVNGLAAAPPTNVMLELYGLYKQASAGDATGSRPGMMDVRGRAKYDAWASRKGMSRDDAMRAYIERAGTL
ncbi:MAG TPA: acyl-CoA-binding protein [Kofleriaceae bacterium]|nr:acyl-CoA-binding protein [Kofleriaceae bacterium]